MVNEDCLMEKRHNHHRRGQAAMEYLMTYGWAILVITIVLSAFLYLNIFTINERIPSLCQFRTGLFCVGIKASTENTGALTMTLANSLPNTIHLCDLICDDRSAADLSLTIPVCTKDTAVVVLKTGEKKRAQFPNSSPCVDSAGQEVEIGTRYLGKLYLLYNEKDDSGNARVAMADLVTTIQP